MATRRNSPLLWPSSKNSCSTVTAGIDRRNGFSRPNFHGRHGTDWRELYPVMAKWTIAQQVIRQERIRLSSQSDFRLFNKRPSPRYSFGRPFQIESCISWHLLHPETCKVIWSQSEVNALTSWGLCCFHTTFIAAITCIPTGKLQIQTNQIRTTVGILLQVHFPSSVPKSQPLRHCRNTYHTGVRMMMVNKFIHLLTNSSTLTSFVCSKFC